MKRAFFLVLICFTVWQVNAQGLVQGKFYPGYVVKESGDTLLGFVKLINLLGNQYRAYYKEDGSEQAEKYGPQDLMSYGVIDRHYESKEWTGDGVDLTRLGSIGQLFLRKIEQGRITVYQYYEDDSGWVEETESGTQLNIVVAEHELHSKWLVQKLDGKIYDMAGTKFIMFKSGMKKYLEDYPDLSKKIGSKGYKRINFLEIIRQYNAYWALE